MEEELAEPKLQRNTESFNQPLFLSVATLKITYQATTNLFQRHKISPQNVTSISVYIFMICFQCILVLVLIELKSSQLNPPTGAKYVR